MELQKLALWGALMVCLSCQLVVLLLSTTRSGGARVAVDPGSKGASVWNCDSNCTIGGGSPDSGSALPPQSLEEGSQRPAHQRGIKHAVQSYSTVSGATTLSSTSSTLVYCNTQSGGLTVTLPAVATMSEGSKAMRYFTIVNKATTSTCTVQTSSSQVIYTNLHTTAWQDTSPYDTVYGGQTAGGSTAAFTDTTTMSPIYVHTAQTLPVTTGHTAAFGRATVVGSTNAAATTTVVASVSATTSTVTGSVSTGGQQCVYNYGRNTGTFRTSANVASTQQVVTGINVQTTNCYTDIAVYNNNDGYATFNTKYVANSPGNRGNFPIIITYAVNFGSHQVPAPGISYRTAATAVNVANYGACATGVSSGAPTQGSAVTSISYQMSAACLGSANRVAKTVVQALTPSPISVVSGFSTNPTPVVNSLPSIASSAAMTQYSVATTVSGNIAVSHGYSLTSPTAVTGVITISDSSSAASTTSVTIRPGGSITLITDGTAWYQIAGSFGETTSL